MRFARLLTLTTVYLGAVSCYASATHDQTPLLRHARTDRNVSFPLFTELEELARIVDISYCVGLTSLGVNKPFKCLSRCSDFPDFELVTTWNTGPLLSDSCGYIALDHGKERILVAFRGTYSIANTVVDLSTVPQEYVPYPGSDGDDDEEERSPSQDVAEDIVNGIGGHAKRDMVPESSKPKCNNCTVHLGFHTAWLITRKHILSGLRQQIMTYPRYQLNLVGHSLGGAVAALGALDLQSRGWNPVVTTFGEPRIGNGGLVKFLDQRFNLSSSEHAADDDTKLKYRRVTHIDDPVPLLPLSEWSYAMHAGEIYISKSSLSPDIRDLEHCKGDNDQKCIARQDSTAGEQSDEHPEMASRERDLLSSIRDEVDDLVHEPWGIPSRYKLWQLFFSHRDYFWRLGLCVPGGDPMGGGEKYGDGEKKEELR